LLILCALLALAVVAALAVTDPMTRRAVPDDGKITLTDYGYRDWGPELVQYTVDPAKYAAGVTVTDANGNTVPAQVNGNTLAFVASLPRGATATYLVKAGREITRTTVPLASAAGDTLLVKNEFLSLRLPKAGTQTFADPIDAAKATPPILQWAGKDGTMMGGARFVTQRKVSEQRFTVLRDGPAVVEYEARYRFVPKGEYVWRVRVSPGVPLAIVSEEFDFGTVTNGEDRLVLDLHKGWQPQNVGWVNGANEQLLPTTSTSAYAAYIEKKKTATIAAAPVGGVGDAPAPYKFEKDLIFLEQIYPGGRWGALKGGQQVWDGADPAAGRSLAVVPLFLGSWRHAMSLETWYKEGAGIEVSLPISVRLSRWSLDVSDDLSPFSSHEHDDGLNFTYGRRMWGLYVGKEMELAQPRWGYIGLDRYKDWTVDYPENKALAKYPGALFDATLVKGLREHIDEHPEAAWLKGRYLISGKTEDAVANAQEIVNKLKAPYQENDFFLNGLSNYRKVQLLMFANRAEDALACPALPADLRAELRRRLAIYANVTSDPDFCPRGVGCHLGNNNMPINRTTALALFAPELPDHPRYAYWMEKIKDFAAFKLVTQTAADGANIECPAYQLYAPSQGLNVSLNVLRNRGYDISAIRRNYKANLIFLANLTMPDPRYKGARIIPGMGNSSNLQESIWGISMATFADDPAFAGWLKYIFRLSGSKFGPESTGVTSVGHAMYYLPQIPENPQPLVTTFVPTYGVMFRNHFGTPNETALLFRAGANWGHWDSDPLNVVLYGKAAPLSPGTGYQYYWGPATQDNAIYHDQVKIGKRNTPEVFGRVDGTITDYGFGPSADYAVARRYYPPQNFDDNKGETAWKRHVLFLKSSQPSGPDYFVLRDTFDGNAVRPTWWTWMNLDGAENISVDGTAFVPNQVPQDKLVPEAQFPKLHGQTVELRTKYGASTWMWFSEPRDVQARMTFKAPPNEVKTIIEVPGATDKGYLYVAYPRGDAEPAPTCASPAPGVLTVTTPESTDTVFLGDAPFSYQTKDIVFTGKAGAVRVYPDRVVLCLNSGSGRIGYKGCIFAGNGPFEQTVMLKGLKRKVTALTIEPEKKVQTVDLGNGVAITGEGPFTATMAGEVIRITTTGRARVLNVTKPPFIIRPQYYIDGAEGMACWTDYPASGWGTYNNAWLISLSVPAGAHELTLKNLTFTPVWTRPFTPAIEGVVKP
jgi:hypothetical protein